MSTKIIYVGNLPWSIEEEELKQLFQEFGEVAAVKLVTDREAGRSKGFAFVEMENADEAIKELNGKEVKNRILRVNEARSRTRVNKVSSELLYEKGAPLSANSKGDNPKPNHDLKSESQSFYGPDKGAILELPEYFPLRTFFDTLDYKKAQTIYSTIATLLEMSDFGVHKEIEPELGSWFRTAKFKAISTLSQKDVSVRLLKIERALELKHIDSVQANTDKTLAEGVNFIIKSLEDVPNAAIQIGTILLIKTTDINKNSTVLSRTLSQKELKILDENPRLLKDPKTLLSKLSTSKPDLNSIAVKDGTTNSEITKDGSFVPGNISIQGSKND